MRDSKREKQSDRILGLLKEHAGQWVGLPEILDLHIGQYNARIFDLRRAGFQIENKIERDDAGEARSWYRLVDSPERRQEPASVLPCPRESNPDPDWKDRPRATGLPLFDSATRGTA